METNALVPKPDAAPMGEPRHWARDFSLIGGITGLSAPLAVAPAIAGSGYAITAAVTGVLTGAFLGMVIPKSLARLKNVRLPVLLFGGIGVGAIWGATVGAVAAFAAGEHFWMFSMGLAGLAGAIQFGWIWLPYVLKKIGKKRTWPLVTGAVLVAPLLGWASVWLFAMLAGLVEMIF